MAIIHDIQPFLSETCFFCGGLIFRTPACKIEGGGGNPLILHAGCVHKLQSMLAQDNQAIKVHFKTNP